MSWFNDQRQQWIAETIGIFGFINREHIMRKFGVSVPQASADLREFQRLHPQAIKYNSSTKRYEVATTTRRAAAREQHTRHIQTQKEMMR